LLDPELVSLLACPNCKGAIEYREEEQVIACTGACGYRYPVVNGIPHMLVEEAVKE
jgi:uncharacterized protein YbaR (Trm112 family)